MVPRTHRPECPSRQYRVSRLILWCTCLLFWRSTVRVWVIFYSDWGFLWFFLISSSKVRRRTLKAPFHILSLHFSLFVQLYDALHIELLVVIQWNTKLVLNPLNPELNPICYFLALLAHHFLHVSRIRVKSLIIRLLMSYIYGAPILGVSRSHTTTQHSR